MPPGWQEYADWLLVKLLTRWEGVRLTPYLCSAKYWTIGIGSVCRDWQSGRMLTSKDPKPAQRLRSTADARALLQRDLPRYTFPVNAALPVALWASQGLFLPGQWAALVSFTYNVGAANFNASTLLRKVKRQDFEGAAREFPKWTLAGGRRLKGLLLRRQAEARLFARGF